MATMAAFQAPSNLYMSTQTGPSPPEQIPYNKGNYGAVLAQTPPSSSVSPTSLHSPGHLNVRQLRNPRQPLYIPAALRPTDILGRPTDIPGRPRAPDTPPASKDNSFDSMKSSLTSMEAVGMPMDGGVLPPSDMDILRRGLSRAASDGLEEDLGEITGPPTTAHWKPDMSSRECAVCQESFTWFFRRHHCRRCGDVVCETHSARFVPLDQNARYHPTGMLSRACDSCHQEWKIVKKLRHSRTSSIAESISSQGTAVPSLPIPNHMRRPDAFRVGSMARSEGGMVWSTF